MNLTRQQKASFGVLAVALAAFGADRLLLGGGGLSQARADPIPVVTDAAGTPLAVAPVRAAVNAPRLAERLESLAMANPGLMEQIPDILNTGEVAHNWVISSVIGQGDAGMVLINGQMVRVGETFGASGAVLKSVHREHAVFVEGGQELIVPVRKSAESQNRSGSGQ